MKNRFYVKKRTLLLIACVVWLLAGFNVAFFYSGLGCALALAGVLFAKNYLCYYQLIEKEQEQR